MKITNKTTKFYLLLLFLLSIYTTSSAQDLKFWHLSVNEGLSNSAVNCFLQDSQGFMWIGTQDGLNRYDGYRIEVFRKDAKNKNSLTHNYINKLHEDRNKNIWISTNGGGLLLYDKLYNRFYQVSEVNSNVVNAFFEDSQGKFWVAGGNILFCYDEQSKKFNSFPKFTESAINALIEIGKDEYLIATEDEGLYTFHAKTNKTIQYKHDKNNPNSISNNTVRGIYKDPYHQVWVGTIKGLDRLDLKTMSFTHFLFSEDKNKSLLINVIRTINGRGDEVWLGTENGGLSMLNLKTMLFTHHIYDSSNPESISDNSIWAIYFDRQNRLWTGTFSGGVNIADPYREKFIKQNIPLKNQTVNTILKDSKNRLWVGTELGLVVKEGDKITHYNHDPKQKNSLPNFPVLAIYEDHQHRIWVGTWAGGLSRFDEEKKNFINTEVDDTNYKKLSNSNIFDIIQSSQTKQLLLASFGGLLVTETENPDSFHTYLADEKAANSLAINYVMALYEDSKKNIWIATTNGLNHFDIINKKFRLYVHNEKDTNSISNNNIQCITEDSKGRLWLGTSDGLNMMLNDSIFIDYNVSDGLAGGMIMGILEDKKGNLWLSTNNGVCKFNPEKRTFRNYSDSDGLQSKQFKADSYFRSKDDEMYFGGVSGFNAFYPDSIKDNPHLPSVLITDLKIFNKSVKIGDYDSLLKKVIQQTQEITLTHQHSVFSLEYVGINFTHSKRNQYAYRLVPFQEDWNYVNDKRESTYTNLDAGTYTFQVKASNNDGVWNEEGITLKINILPPWWKTWWFRGGLLLLVVVTIVTYNRIKMATLRKRNLVLEQKVLERTKDLKFASEQIKTKNEELQASEEELRQNMEELETNQELLKSQKEQLEVAFTQLHQQNTKVNDSIRYAERIQQAILPHEEVLKLAFADHFVIYKPKDVVSGDFYWYFETNTESGMRNLALGTNTMMNDELLMTNEKPPITNHYLPTTIQNKKKFLAVVDCTGHGVPGAFMSMIGNTLLREIVESKGIHQPADILTELNKSIISALNRRDRSFQDGMDIVLCCLENTSTSQIKLTYAGAKRPLYYFDNELHELRSNHTSIGHKADTLYNQLEAVLQPNTTLYLTTDGWIDIINYERNRFGSLRFKEMLKNGAFLAMDVQKEIFLKELDAYQQASEQRDDILMVGVRV